MSTLPQTKKRTGAFVSTYLILRQGQDILLLLRKNTGFCDGRYGLVSGHVEDGESASAAMVREAKEEAGIEIMPSHLKVVHILHRKSDRFNIDIFFQCNSWQGSIVNAEPEKCSCLEFFPLSQLPYNIIPYVKEVIEASSTGNFYSEQGWE